MSTSEVCRTYGISRETVRLWVTRGLPVSPETPEAAPGGRRPFYLFRLADVVSFVAAKEAKGGIGKRGPDGKPRKRRGKAAAVAQAEDK